MIIPPKNTKTTVRGYENYVATEFVSKDILIERETTQTSLNL